MARADLKAKLEENLKNLNNEDQEDETAPEQASNDTAGDPGSNDSVGQKASKPKRKPSGGASKALKAAQSIYGYKKKP